MQNPLIVQMMQKQIQLQQQQLKQQSVGSDQLRRQTILNAARQSRIAEMRQKEGELLQRAIYILKGIHQMPPGFPFPRTLEKFDLHSFVDRLNVAIKQYNQAGKILLQLHANLRKQSQAPEFDYRMDLLRKFHSWKLTLLQQIQWQVDGWRTLCGEKVHSQQWVSVQTDQKFSANDLQFEAGPSNMNEVAGNAEHSDAMDLSEESKNSDEEHEQSLRAESAKSPFNHENEQQRIFPSQQAAFNEQQHKQHPSEHDQHHIVSRAPAVVERKCQIVNGCKVDPFICFQFQ